MPYLSKSATTAIIIATTALGATATSATAAPVIQKIGGGSFSGLSAVDAGHSFNTGGAVTTCDDGVGGGATYSNISGSGTTASMTFNTAFSDCALDISGLYCRVVASPGTWTRTATGPSPATSWGAQLSISNQIVISVDDPACGITTCVIVIAVGGPWSGGTFTNVAGGISFSGTASSMAYTATNSCGIGASGAASYTVPGMTIPGIQVS